MKKIALIIMGVLSTLIGLYPILYFVIDRKFALLASKSEALLADTLWNIAFYGHIIFGGLALLIGWAQFSENFRNKRVQLHRQIGKTYVVSVIISGFTGVYIAFFATGGLVSMLGFLSLSVIWLATTILSYTAIKNRDVAAHEKFMIYSYAACLAAVTLRIWLPLLILALGDFNAAYPLVAWFCWVPNLIAAYFIVNIKFRPAAAL